MFPPPSFSSGGGYVYTYATQASSKFIDGAHFVKMRSLPQNTPALHARP